MNWDRVEGQWKQIKGKAKTKWGQLTDDDLTSVAGNKDQLVGRIQERYGIAKDEAQRQVDEWHNALDDSNDQAARREAEHAELNRKVS